METVKLDGDLYFKISNYDEMDPFLMSIVSDGNHWMFISSNGGLTAGRKDADHALFPYYTDDKLTELQETTGSKSIFRVEQNRQSLLWEPFSIRQAHIFAVTRNLYKSYYGNKVMFEEINHDLQLTFRYQWSTSNRFGFVRQSQLINNSAEQIDIQVLDGIQNIMPYGVSADLQGIRSNLVDAYKRSELDPTSGLGLFSLSAIIVDRAEPSEALKTNVAWSYGMDQPIRLLSSGQLESFRRNGEVQEEIDVKAKKGAYFIVKPLRLGAQTSQDWIIVSNVNQGPAAVIALKEQILSTADLDIQIRKDVEMGTGELRQIVSAADGFQKTADDRRDARHYSNTLFNVMRGGIIDDNYWIHKADFQHYLTLINKSIARQHKGTFEALDDPFTHSQLRDCVEKTRDTDLYRIAMEYLPIRFSRRHGDPSRPWNKFSINTTSEIDGSNILDYEGNWRDIFQNWEALAKSFPMFMENMIFKFLNASTFDGYNPYRVTKDGFDWEVIEEHDPWSYIGYWGDHQIIYLLKFLEFQQEIDPSVLVNYLNTCVFVYANVPYRIKSYAECLQDPKDTILFDFELDHTIREERAKRGADAAVIVNRNDELHRVSFLEKLLATLLAKMSNFIPEGGIWLNTQRPEWNDANNALVGNGVSMVTLCYLRRFLSYFRHLIHMSTSDEYVLSKELLPFFNGVKATLETHVELLADTISDQDRKTILNGLGNAGSSYREEIYANGFSGEQVKLSREDLVSFIQVSLDYIDHSIQANKRKDGMYHAYNIMTVRGEDLTIGHLDEMLEGQVAVLSSGHLTPAESLQVLDAMKKSALFREDQYSYLLYPNKDLPGFLEKNQIPEDDVMNSKLLMLLVEDGNAALIERDVLGNCHFSGSFHNRNDVENALDRLPESYQAYVHDERQEVLDVFERVFNHKAFTGRSGTFYGYEGLGSIYWHMVSKLLLAVEETCLAALKSNTDKRVIGRLMEHYYEINAGIGVHKSPELYGAFPVDPYSHTPTGKGAQQPGLTGQVKEDILARIGELGVQIEHGRVHFSPYLLRNEEFLNEPAVFHYIDLNKQEATISLQPYQLAFTCCQVPIVYEIAKTNQMVIHRSDGSTEAMDGLHLDDTTSKELFDRKGTIKRIHVYLQHSHLNG